MHYYFIDLDCSHTFGGIFGFLELLNFLNPWAKAIIIATYRGSIGHSSAISIDRIARGISRGFLRNKYRCFEDQAASTYTQMCVDAWLQNAKTGFSIFAMRGSQEIIFFEP
jgi:hypothetical protein